MHDRSAQVAGFRWSTEEGYHARQGQHKYALSREVLRPYLCPLLMMGQPWRPLRLCRE